MRQPAGRALAVVVLSVTLLAAASAAQLDDAAALQRMVEADWTAQEHRLGREPHSVEAIREALRRVGRLVQDRQAPPNAPRTAFEKELALLRTVKFDGLDEAAQAGALPADSHARPRAGARASGHRRPADRVPQAAAVHLPDAARVRRLLLQLREHRRRRPVRARRAGAVARNPRLAGRPSAARQLHHAGPLLRRPDRLLRVLRGPPTRRGRTRRGRTGTGCRPPTAFRPRGTTIRPSGPASKSMRWTPTATMCGS